MFVSDILFTISVVKEWEMGVNLIILRFISDGIAIGLISVQGIVLVKNNIINTVINRVIPSKILVSCKIVGWGRIGEIFHKIKELKHTLPLPKIIVAKLWVIG